MAQMTASDRPIPVAGRNRPKGERLIGAFLMADGAVVLGLWANSLGHHAFGGLRDLFVYQDGNYPLLHVTAEALMGATALGAGVALCGQAPIGPRLAGLALGMLGYSAINSSGWPLRHNPTLLFPMASTLVGVALSVPYLFRRPAERGSALRCEWR